jgi:hypothetical protein
MGGASTAVSWGDLNTSGNPALLGYANGIRHAHGRTPLLRGVVNDILLYNDATLMGGYGLGFVFSGRPIEKGGVLLDYGSSAVTDVNGNVVGTFSARERTRSWGAGVSLLHAAESAVALRGGARPTWSRYADFSVGMTWKDVTVALAPGSETRASARDWGIHARVTPVDGLGRGDGPPIRFDITYGLSVLNHDDGAFTFPNEDAVNPLPRQHRRGGAMHIAAFTLPTADEQGLLRGLGLGLTPLVSASFAFDHTDHGLGDSSTHGTAGWGLEFTLANLITGRRGRYEDPLSSIAGATWGFGMALPVGALGGASFDKAWFPQSSGLPHAHRTQFTVWVDPIAIATRRR